MKHTLFSSERSWSSERANLDFGSISASFAKSISQLPAVDQARLASLSIMNQFGMQQAKEILGLPEPILNEWLKRYLPQMFRQQRADGQHSLYSWKKNWLAAFSHLLNQNYSGMLEQLYRRAEPWLSQTDCCSNGVQYLIQQSDNKWAQRTLGSLCRTWLEQHDASAIISLVESLPESIYQDSPNLLLSYIWALMVQRRIAEATTLLTLAEARDLDPNFDPGRPFSRLQSSIQALRYLEQFHSQAKSSSSARIRILEQALQLESEFQGAVLTTYASLLHSVGIVDSSKQAIKQAIHYHQNKYNTVQLAQVKSLYWQCDFNQGNCQRALCEAELYLQYLQQQLAEASSVERHGLTVAIAVINANIGHFYHEVNQVLRAKDAFRAALPELSGTDFQYSVIASNVGLIRLFTSAGDIQQSQALLDSIIGQANWRDDSWLNAVMCFEKMRVQRLRGQSVKPIAEEYALLSRPLSVDTLFMDEYEKAHLFWIKCKLLVLLEEERYNEANVLALKGLIKSMAVEDMRFQIVFSAVKALCEFKTGDEKEAASSIERALKLMQKHGFRRSLLDDDFGWSVLWDEMDSKDRFSSDILPSLLSEIRSGLMRFTTLNEDSASQNLESDERAMQLLRCKSVGLTEKEYEIIKLLAEGLCNKKIASRSDIALTTVKWHLQNIFGKLQVRNRTEAVVKAQELGVLKG